VLHGAGPALVVAPEHLGDLDHLGELLAAAGHHSETREDHLQVALDGADPRRLAAALNRAAGTGGIVLTELRVARTSLEDRYLTMVENGDPR
jgi:hypothetical protein